MLMWIYCVVATQEAGMTGERHRTLALPTSLRETQTPAHPRSRELPEEERTRAYGVPGRLAVRVAWAQAAGLAGNKERQ